jgi:hypothetical protein
MNLGIAKEEKPFSPDFLRFVSEIQGKMMGITEVCRAANPEGAAEVSRFPVVAALPFWVVAVVSEQGLGKVVAELVVALPEAVAGERTSVAAEPPAAGVSVEAFAARFAAVVAGFEVAAEPAVAVVADP